MVTIKFQKDNQVVMEGDLWAVIQLLSAMGVSAVGTLNVFRRVGVDGLLANAVVWMEMEERRVNRGNYMLDIYFLYLKIL